MKKKNCLIIVLICVMILSFTGCASVFNPYQEEYQCPDTYKGKCVSMKTAYNESIEGVKYNKEDGKENPLVKSNNHKSNNAQDEYQKRLYKKLADIIEEPEVPVVIPPKILRVLILSYTNNDNDMYGHRFVYILAQEPKWVFSAFKEGE
ncbi:MAG: TraV family lipoprotein [Proteobacteria bacterium]|nr:TraV family lipoprotein [Pseudomonadota bacterium]